MWLLPVDTEGGLSPVAYRHRSSARCRSWIWSWTRRFHVTSGKYITISAFLNPWLRHSTENDFTSLSSCPRPRPTLLPWAPGPPCPGLDGPWVVLHSQSLPPVLRTQGTLTVLPECLCFTSLFSSYHKDVGFFFFGCWFLKRTSPAGKLGSGNLTSQHYQVSRNQNTLKIFISLPTEISFISVF